MNKATEQIVQFLTQQGQEGNITIWLYEQFLTQQGQKGNRIIWLYERFLTQQGQKGNRTIWLYTISNITRPKRQHNNMAI